MLNIDAEERLRLLIYEAASKSSKLTPSVSWLISRFVVVFILVVVCRFGDFGFSLYLRTFLVHLKIQIKRVSAKNGTKMKCQVSTFCYLNFHYLCAFCIGFCHFALQFSNFGAKKIIASCLFGFFLIIPLHSSKKLSSWPIFCCISQGLLLSVLQQESEIRLAVRFLFPPLLRFIHCFESNKEPIWKPM